MIPRVIWWNYPTLGLKNKIFPMQKVFNSLVFLCACPPRLTRNFAGQQRLQAAKSVRRGGKSYRADHNFFAPLRLCAKKNPSWRTRNSAGQAVKSPSRQRGVSPLSLSQNRTWQSPVIRLLLFLIKIRLYLHYLPVIKEFRVFSSYHLEFRSCFSSACLVFFLKPFYKPFFHFY